MSKWIETKDQLPDHMQEVVVFIENPYFGSFERIGNAVFLGFTREFCDSKDQIALDYVTKWKPINDLDKV